MRISVLGTGYLGATHAACLAHVGHDVIGVDHQADRVAHLSTGRAPFAERGLDELLRKGLQRGSLHFTTRVESVAPCDVHFLCVGTPEQSSGGATDLTAVVQAVDGVAGVARPDSLIVGKSTVPVGTTATLKERLQSRPWGSDGSVAWNPEFLREGHAVVDSLRPSRLVFGVDSESAYQVLCDVYREPISGGTPVVRTDPQTAELAKASANVMLASRISMINALAEVCGATRASISDLVEILALDVRIGSRYLHPGLGFGGGCLPKDLRGFAARARELGIEAPQQLFAEIDGVNQHQRTLARRRAIDLLGRDAPNSTVAALGATFKADSDDLRDSPALEVARSLRPLVHTLRVYDPAAGPQLVAEAPELTVVNSVDEAVAGADLLLILTEWSEFRSLDPVELADHVRCPTVLDARLLLDHDKWRASGWRVATLGGSVE